MINKSLIGFSNTQSVNTSSFEINNYPPYELLFLSETWLKKNQKNPLLQKYKEILRIDNENNSINSKRNYAGLLLLQNIHSNLYINTLSYSHTHIHILFYTYNLIFIYFNPTYTYIDLFNEFTCLLDRLENLGNVIIFGDFNCNSISKKKYKI